MTMYLSKRFASALALLFAVATFVFLLIHLMPGDVAYLIVGEEASLEAIERVRVQLGLDRPLTVQYWDYVNRLVRGDFGASLFTGRSVVGDVLVRVPRTLELVVVSTLLAVLIGIPLGLVSALKQDSWLDHFLTTLGLLGLSAPAFVRGTLLVLLFGLTLKWLPSSGFVAFSEDPVGHILRLLLPAVTLALGNGAVVMRMTRASVLDVKGADYIRTARSKGLSSRSVFIKHALRSALIPIITTLGLQMGNMFGGAVVVEAIFNWPGLSSLLLMATSRRDYPIVQAVILFIAFMYVLINLVVDLAYSRVDPRVRYA